MDLATFLRDYNVEPNHRENDLEKVIDCKVFRSGNLKPIFSFTLTLPNEVVSDAKKYVLTDEQDIKAQVISYAKSILETWIEFHP